MNSQDEGLQGAVRERLLCQGRGCIENLGYRRRGHASSLDYSARRLRSGVWGPTMHEKQPESGGWHLL